MALDPMELNLLRRMSIGDLPTRTASRLPDREAILFQDKRVTFKELNDNCCKFANAFAKLGVGKGDRVAFMTHNCLQYVYSWLGLAKLGAVVVPMNFMLKGPEIKYIVNHAEPKLLFVEDSLTAGALEVAGDLTSVEKFGYIPLTGAEGPEGWMDLDSFFEGGDVSEPRVSIDDSDMATLMYTSGTEALPKGVMTEHRNFFIALLMASIDLNFTGTDTALLSIPLYHVAGKLLLLQSILTGAKLVLEYAPNPVEILELTVKEKVTYWVYPPTLYQVLPLMPGFAESDLSSLKKCVSFGALMPSALLEQWKGILPGAEWRNFYGQTESSPCGSTLQPGDFERKIDSIGRPHITVEMGIMDFEGEKFLPAGEVGEIVMRGPSVMRGYYKDEEKTDAAFTGGWLHTGDIGKFDDEGFLHFIDRMKDIIKSGGENVSSQEVEEVVLKHEKVMQTAVIGMPHEHWVEMVTAVVVPNPGVELTEEELVAFCKENMAGYKVPKKVIVVDEMPVSPSGKVLKRVLREELLEE